MRVKSDGVHIGTANNIAVSDKASGGHTPPHHEMLKKVRERGRDGSFTPIP